MAEIRWTKEAQRWLKDIHDYIAVDKPEAVARVIENIYIRVQALKRMPEIGYRYPRCPEHQIRILLYGHYRIAYLIKPDRDIDTLGVSMAH